MCATLIDLSYRVDESIVSNGSKPCKKRVLTAGNELLDITKNLRENNLQQVVRADVLAGASRQPGNNMLLESSVVVHEQLLQGDDVAGDCALDQRLLR